MATDDRATLAGAALLGVPAAAVFMRDVASVSNAFIVWWLVYVIGCGVLLNTQTGCLFRFGLMARAPA